MGEYLDPVLRDERTPEQKRKAALQLLRQLFPMPVSGIRFMEVNPDSFDQEDLVRLVGYMAQRIGKLEEAERERLNRKHQDMFDSLIYHSVRPDLVGSG